MTNDELRALADALDQLKFRCDGIDDACLVEDAADYLRACADAQPVPVVPVDWTGRLKEAVKHIGYANVEKWYRLGGEDMIEQAKSDAVTAYATLCEALESLAAAPSAPQAEPDDELVLGEPDILTPEDVRRAVPQEK